MTLAYNHILNTTWAFMKEISSDGDVSTVDVIYPACPLIFYKNPYLFHLILLPILDYANNDTARYGLGSKYNLPWSPHHLGTWPISYITSGEQEQMPVEETANMLILIDYITNKYSTQLYGKYGPLLETWGNYLISSLPDPGDQLCTDDFEGPSPHNTNLALKGIVGLGAWSDYLKQIGDTQNATRVQAIAKVYASYWEDHALNPSDKDHYKLQYDLSNTWSLKYNLLFDVIL